MRIPTRETRYPCRRRTWWRHHLSARHGRRPLSWRRSGPGLLPAEQGATWFDRTVGARDLAGCAGAKISPFLLCRRAPPTSIRHWGWRWKGRRRPCGECATKPWEDWGSGEGSCLALSSSSGTVYLTTFSTLVLGWGPWGGGGAR
jgi:hypothetical protein